MEAATTSVGGMDQRILDATNNCFRRFDEYITSNGRSNEAHAADLRHRLEIWAKYSGARAREGLSLDDRLKEHGDIQNAVLGLLEIANVNLERVVSAPDKDVKPGEWAVASKTDEAEVSEDMAIKSRWRNYHGTPWEAIDAAIDGLLNLAKVIRKSTVSKRDARVPPHFVRPDDGYFEEMAKILARSRFPDARRTLTDQLGSSIFTRRRRLLYQKRHEDKLAHQHPEPISLANTESLTTPIPGDKAPVIRPRDRIPLQKASAPAALHQTAVPPSETELSKIDNSVLSRRRKAPTTISGRTGGSVSREEGQPDYPKLPPFERSRRDCICPYCSEPLSTAKLSIPSYWEKHVDNDLEPYVCISEKCRDPIRFFVHQDEWLRHMNSSHAEDWAQKIHMTTWFCDLGHTLPLEFNDEHAFCEHLKTQHEDVNKWHTNALLRRKRGLGCRDSTVCPFCERAPENIPTKMNPHDKLSMLFSHIGNHLRSLSFFSLPSPDGDEGNDADASSSGANIMSGSSQEKDQSRGLDNHSGNDSAMKEIPLVFDEDDSKARFLDSALLSTEYPEGLVTLPQHVEWESYSGLSQEYEGEDAVLGRMKRLQEQKQIKSHRRNSPGLRLLRVTEDGIFNLSQFTDDDPVPPYAILSHTRLEDTEELTFEDLMNGTGKEKLGYTKIRFCEEQGRLDGLQYFWVDSCCIDKSNKAEVQKAVNSMFHWYRNAARCYVYLSDVSTSNRKASDRLAEFTWESAFRASRWFTRGWTLQELLAPQSVEFFSCEGKRLGSKHSLQQQIHEITGVPTSEDHSDLAIYLNNLSNKLGRWYERTGDMADLEEAIQVARQTVALTPEDHSDLAMCLNNLGTKLESRYERTGDMADLEEAMQIARRVVASTSEDHSDLAIYLNNLSNKLGRRYERTGDIADLEEAIQVARRAVALTPEDHSDLAGYLNNLGDKLQRRYERMGDMADLEEANRVFGRS